MRFWSRHTEGAVSQPRAYLGRAVFLNALKQRSRRREELPLEAIPEPLTDEPLHVDPIEMERAITGLSTRLQTVIRLRFYLGLTFHEIGSALRISTNTAASRCRYGIQQLRKVFEPKTSR
jgi:RNA polymerase sigma factor (sigma-70 family)